MNFGDFLGNDGIKQRLNEAERAGRLSHAWLLIGPEGSGRHTLARQLIAAMQCTADGERPCMRCTACKKVLSDMHPDVITVDAPDKKTIPVKLVRDACADLFVRPNEGARKIYIFEDCTILTEKDQNILLKLVEEGPAYAAFFFCAENPAVLLQTIRSRCAEVKLAPAAQERAAPDENALELARRIAKGTRASRAAFLTRLEAGKVSREALADLFEQARLLLAGALLLPYGSPPRAGTEEVVQLLASRLTKPQILCTIDLLQTYRSHCSYNVGVGPTLGGFAVELEEIL